jgi:curli production assembly/transport component CsgF
MKKVLICLGFLAFVGIIEVDAQQLVYRPVNPNFGGDTFNYQFLLQSAQAQNSFTDPNAQRGGFGFGNQGSELDQFAESLNRQFLSQITRNLFASTFGEDGLRPGTFTFGSLVIEIFESTEGLVIDILDISNGDQTQVVIPN